MFIIGCQQIRFENLGHVPPIGEPLARITLSAYVMEFGVLEGKATAFNFSIDNVNFNSKYFSIYLYLQKLMGNMRIDLCTFK